jgi:hypothetical protein
MDAVGGSWFLNWTSAAEEEWNLECHGGASLMFGLMFIMPYSFMFSPLAELFSAFPRLQMRTSHSHHAHRLLLPAPWGVSGGSSQGHICILVSFLFFSITYYY